MAELPKSWGLKTRKKADRLEVLQTGTDGKEYRARLCEGAELTDHDVAEIARHDGEHVTSEDIARRALADRENYWKQVGDRMEADYAEPAEQVAYAGLHVYSRTVGYSRRYARNYEAWLRTLDS